jgi:hypothetical protein
MGAHVVHWPKQGQSRGESRGGCEDVADSDCKGCGRVGGVIWRGMASRDGGDMKKHELSVNTVPIKQERERDRESPLSSQHALLQGGVVVLRIIPGAAVVWGRCASCAASPESLAFFVQGKIYFFVRKFLFLQEEIEFFLRFFARTFLGQFLAIFWFLLLGNRNSLAGVAVS